MASWFGVRGAKDAVAGEFSKKGRVLRDIAEGFRQARAGQSPSGDEDFERLTEGEFRQRYRNVRANAILIGVFATVSAIFSMAAGSAFAWLSFGIFGTLSSALTMLYLKTCFRLWVGRRMLSDRGTAGGGKVRFHQYLRAVEKDFFQILPLAAPRTGPLSPSKLPQKHKERSTPVTTGQDKEVTQ